ncbi:sensor histidine kinase [Opitutus terrae]|nr:HAMP domain-containing sensor histidine kinase [Opitutus terrae]
MNRGDANGNVLTHYAPAERVDAGELRAQLDFVANDPVIDGLMRVVGGLLAVLNEQRQVLAVNDRLLQLLGLGSAEQAFGLRLGEAVHCVHAHAMPGGCGTSEYCSTCGAAIAQVTSLAENRAVERVCAIDVAPPIAGSDHLFFRVQACPLRREGRRILLLVLQDITEEQQRALLDRTFYHDVKNTLCAVIGASEMLAMDRERSDADMADHLVEMTRRLSREIELQRCLVTARPDGLGRITTRVTVRQVLEDLERACVLHPAVRGRRLRVQPAPAEAPVLATDPTLLGRVLQNMVINALEATPDGAEARVWAERAEGAIEFCVWNDAVITAENARRIFQRNFSTKGTIGRGLGTYSMKLLGEQVLGGRVSFTSTPDAGTCFRIRLEANDVVAE